jgi:hypothetical protein
MWKMSNIVGELIEARIQPFPTASQAFLKVFKVYTFFYQPPTPQWGNGGNNI